MFNLNIKDIRTTKDILFVNWVGDKHTGVNISIHLQTLLKSFRQQKNFSVNYLQTIFSFKMFDTSCDVSKVL